MYGELIYELIVGPPAAPKYTNKYTEHFFFFIFLICVGPGKLFLAFEDIHVKLLTESSALVVVA